MKLILAVDEEGGIGRDGLIPWRLSEDMALFSKLTSGGVVIMGVRTAFSLPSGPLTNRINVVYAPNTSESYICALWMKGFVVETKLDSLLAYQDAWLIGGRSVIFESLIDEAYITYVLGKHNCNTRVNLDPLLSQFCKNEVILKTRNLEARRYYDKVVC